MGTMYLARLPHSLWEAWSKLDDDAEIQIGTIRQWNEVGKDGVPHVRFPTEMLLAAVLTALALSPSCRCC